MMEGFDRSRWPTPLATVEDYERACSEFVIDYLARAAKNCFEGIEVLQAKLDELEDSKLSDADLKKYMLNVEAPATFPKAINEFMEEVAALEQKLSAEGAFDEES
jgi:CHAD domain-containing protein